MKQKNILIIDAHSRAGSFSDAICDIYEKSARDAGHAVKKIVLRDLKFDPILKTRYRDNILEEDLQTAQENISWCNHLVIVTPVWWMMVPALFKGFIDRTITPGFAFKYKKGSLLPLPERLLKGRSARVIYTQDGPKILTNIVAFDAFWKSLKYGTLVFCGFFPVSRTVFSKVRASSDEKRKKWLKKVENLAKKAK